MYFTGYRPTYNIDFCVYGSYSFITGYIKLLILLPIIAYNFKNMNKLSQKLIDMLEMRNNRRYQRQ